MKKAFATSFPKPDENANADVEVSAEAAVVEVDEEIEIENAGLWNDLPPDDIAHVDLVFANVSKQKRQSCFTHTLQLAINDSLRETK